MATINQNGVNFNIETGGYTHQGWGKKYTNANNILDGVYDPDPQDIYKSLNAIEIDWNSAIWSSIPGTTVPTTINTTGDLLKAIKYAAVQQKPVIESAGIHGTFCTKQRLEHSNWRSA